MRGKTKLAMADAYFFHRGPIFMAEQTVRTAIEYKRQGRDDIVAWADQREAQVCGAKKRRTEGPIQGVTDTARSRSES